MAVLRWRGGKPNYAGNQAVECKRPGFAHLFGGAPANDIGFLCMMEDLRWDRDTSRTRHVVPFGRFTSRHGIEVARAVLNIAATID
jgi:hypothetical protein